MYLCKSNKHIFEKQIRHAYRSCKLIITLYALQLMPASARPIRETELTSDASFQIVPPPLPFYSMRHSLWVVISFFNVVHAASHLNFLEIHRVLDSLHANVVYLIKFVFMDLYHVNSCRKKRSTFGHDTKMNKGERKLLCSNYSVQC